MKSRTSGRITSYRLRGRPRATPPPPRAGEGCTEPLSERGGRVLDDDAGEPVQADDLDDAPDLRLRAADADEPPGPAQAPRDDREVEQERAVRKGQLAQVDDQIALGRERAGEGPAAPPPRRDVLVSRAAQ